MRTSSLSLFICVLPALAAACGGAPPTPAPLSQTPPPMAQRPAPLAPTPAALATCDRRRPTEGPARLGAASRLDSASAGAASRQGSSVALARLGASTLAYVADEDERALHTINVDTRAELAVTPLAGAPAQILILADGRVAVTLRDRNKLQILEPFADPTAPLEPRCTASVAVEPIGLAASPDDRMILVTSGFGHTLSALDEAALRPLFTVDLAREPRAVLVADDGKKAFVSHVVGAKMSAVDLASSAHPVHEIDLRVGRAVPRSPNALQVESPFRIEREEQLRPGCQGFALARASVAEAAGRIFAPMVTVDPGEGGFVDVRTTGYGGGGSSFSSTTESPLVSVVDAAAERALTKTLVVDLVAGPPACLLPRAAVLGDKTGSLYVACLGIDALLELDARSIDPGRVERRRWSVAAGPTGVALDEQGRRAVVWSAFDRAVSIIDLAGGADAKVARVYAARRASSTITQEIALGRRLFHQTGDLRVARDGRACASCHPDGREDALTWSTPDGPRQTIMLAGRVQGTLPYGWLGGHENLKAHVTETLRRLGGAGFPEKTDKLRELDALLAYLGAMPHPVLSEAARAPERDALVARGEALFLEQKRGCVTCHAKGGTDQLVHDVGSGREADKKPAFDTPSLRFVGGTAPYFHDGRYPTLEALLEGSDGKMGHTLDLSHDDVIALKAYLETLGANDEASLAREKAGGWSVGAKSPPPELPVTRVPLPRFGLDAIARTPGAITAIALSDLAVTSIPAPLSGSPEPSTVSEEEARDLVIDGGSGSIAEALREADKDGFFVNAHVRGRAIGRLQIGLLEAPVSARVITVRAHCGGVGGTRYVPARWETIAVAKGSDLTFEVTDAWLDTMRCKAYVASRVSVLAKPIAGSSLFAFRDACPTCGPIENLQIIGPRFDVFSAHSSGGRAEVKSASFTHATLPMQKGGGAVLLARVFQDSARDFRGNSGRGAAPDRDTVFGVEVAEAVGDRAPVALSYMTALEP